MAEIKKIYSNYNGQTPSTGKEVEDAVNENFETLNNEIVQLAGETVEKITKITDSAAIINIDKEYPLESGNYTLNTAVEVIPVTRRKSGLIITWKTQTGDWKTFRYTNTILTNSAFRTTRYWQDITEYNQQGNWFTEVGYVTDEGVFSTSSGYLRTNYIKLTDTLIARVQTRNTVSPVVFFDVDKKFISAHPGTGSDSYTPTEIYYTKDTYPPGAYYAILSTINITGQNGFNPETFLYSLKNLYFDIQDLEEKIKKLGATGYKVINGYNIRSSGEVIANPANKITEAIPVTPGQLINFNLPYVKFTYYANEITNASSFIKNQAFTPFPQLVPENAVVAIALLDAATDTTGMIIEQISIEDYKKSHLLKSATGRGYEIIDGYYVSSSGAVSKNEAYKITELIPVTPGKRLEINIPHIRKRFYNSYLTNVETNAGGSSSHLTTVPEGAKVMVVVFDINTDTSDLVISALESTVLKKDIIRHNIIPANNIIYAAHMAGIMRITSSTVQIIPEQSIWSLQAAHRMGYKYVQCNSHKTADGYWVLQHDIAVNRTMTDINGIELTEDKLVTEMALEYIKHNFRYKSTIPQYRTQILELSEFCKLCKQYGIVPVFNNERFDDAALNILTNTLSENFGIFSTYREFPYLGCNYLVYCWVGYDIDTPEAAVNRMDAIGKPAIYGANAAVWTEEHSQTLRKAGYLCAPASVYNESNWPNVLHLADFNVTDIFCPPPTGAVEIASSELNWEDFQTTGTINEDGTITLTPGNTLTYEGDRSYFLAKVLLDMAFVGTLRIKCGEIPNSSLYTYARTEQDMMFSVNVTIVNSNAKLTVVAQQVTVLRSIVLKVDVV